MKRFLLFFFVLYVPHISSVQGQGLPLPSLATGKNYVISLPAPVENLTDPQFPNSALEQSTLYAYSDLSTSVCVTNAAISWQTCVTTVAGEFTAIQLPTGSGSKLSSASVVSDLVFQVAAEDPIVLYCYLGATFGSEAWTPLPIEHCGTQYQATTLQGSTVQDVQISGAGLLITPKAAPSQIIINSAFDNTHVTIQPNAALASDLGSASPILVTMNANQAYMIRSQVDLSGTEISSDQKISVVSGNSRAALRTDISPITGNSYQGLMIEALPPLEQHGKTFVYLPLWDSHRMKLPLEPSDPNRRQKEELYVHGVQPGQTNGTITDGFGGLIPFSINQFGVYNNFVQEAVARVVDVDKPSQAFLYPESVVNVINDGYASWSGSSVSIIPLHQWTTKAPFIAPNHLPYGEHFVSIVAEYDDMLDVYYSVGGGARQNFSFNHGNIPGSGYVWGTMAIIPGVTYLIEGDEGAHFTGYAYGDWKGYELYRPGKSHRSKTEQVLSGGSAEYEEVVGLSYAYPLAPLRSNFNETAPMNIE